MSNKKQEKKTEELAAVGHNGAPEETRIAGVAADQLKSIIERIENLKEDITALNGDVRDVFQEAKGNGFDVKTIREMIKLRAMDAAERDAKEHLRDLYARALGFNSYSDFEADQLD